MTLDFMGDVDTITDVQLAEKLGIPREHARQRLMRAERQEILFKKSRGVWTKTCPEDVQQERVQKAKLSNSTNEAVAVIAKLIIEMLATPNRNSLIRARQLCNIALGLTRL
jgi:hypothetical protein